MAPKTDIQINLSAIPNFWTRNSLDGGLPYVGLETSLYPHRESLRYCISKGTFPLHGSMHHPNVVQFIKIYNIDTRAKMN